MSSRGELKEPWEVDMAVGFLPGPGLAEFDSEPTAESSSDVSGFEDLTGHQRLARIYNEAGKILTMKDMRV